MFFVSFVSLFFPSFHSMCLFVCVFFFGMSYIEFDTYF